MKRALEWLAYHRRFWEAALSSLVNYLEPAAKSAPGPKKIK